MALTEIKTSGIADDAVTTDKLANAINTERTANTAKVSLDADSVTGAKIADDAVGAEHIEQLDADLSFADSAKAKFGAGDDIQIYHTGSYSYIDNTHSGGLWFRGGTGNHNIGLQAKNSQNSILCTGDSSVDLYHSGTLQCYTAADGLAFPSGKGISFAATSDYTGAGSGTPSELLDDYEEGTFTPRFQTSNGNWGGSMSSQEGSYTKIGNVVHVRFRLFWGSVSGSGNFRITALPFTVANTNSNQGGPVIGVRSGFNYQRLTSYFLINNQQLQFQFIDASAPYGSFDLSAGALASTGHVYCSGWYETA